MGFRSVSLIVAVAASLSSHALALMETAEVLPAGVPNFIIELQYDLKGKVVDPTQALDKFGFTYHFGVGFRIGPVKSDIDIYRRFGPALASEAGIVLETQALSEEWVEKAPSVSVLYGWVTKTHNIYGGLIGSSTNFHAFRHGILVSHGFRLGAVFLTPFIGIQGDYIFNPDPAGGNWAGALNFGVSGRPWFFSIVRMYLEGQVSLQYNIHAVVTGFEVVLSPTLEGQSY